ncbi:MAG: hypothetical protein DWQ04_16520 [Chloroflexi bacterium]|nr:MAG: hypothetical protein DWQ04_16520 [Chloroflexota bacterium]
MKGVIFTEFLEMVEEAFAPEMVDQIIELSQLSSDGAYTSLGNYSHHEILQLVTHLSQQTDIPISELVKEFGKHLINRFAFAHPDFFTQAESTFAFMESVDRNVHIEVKKLYQNANPPSFEYSHPESGKLMMTYRSKRPFSDLAEGLILGAVEYFGENITVARQDIAVEQGAETQFTLTKGKRNE